MLPKSVQRVRPEVLGRGKTTRMTVRPEGANYQ
jgi:hypothetical protein